MMVNFKWHVFCGTRDQTQDIENARQVLYKWATFPTVIGCLEWIITKLILKRQSRNLVSQEKVTVKYVCSSKGMWCCPSRNT
jgi:hypothetical protein